MRHDVVVRRGEMRVGPRGAVFRLGVRAAGEHEAEQRAGFRRRAHLAGNLARIAGLDDRSAPVDRDPRRAWEGAVGGDGGEHLVLEGQESLGCRVPGSERVAVLDDDARRAPGPGEHGVERLAEKTRGGGDTRARSRCRGDRDTFHPVGADHLAEQHRRAPGLLEEPDRGIPSFRVCGGRTELRILPRPCDQARHRRDDDVAIRTDPAGGAGDILCRPWRAERDLETGHQRALAKRAVDRVFTGFVEPVGEGGVGSYQVAH